MASAREIEKRITSFSKTKQITRTMELVATSRMKKTHDRLMAAKPYAEKLAGILGSMNLDEFREDFLLLQAPEETRRVALLVVATSMVQSMRPIRSRTSKSRPISGGAPFCMIISSMKPK